LAWSCAASLRECSAYGYYSIVFVVVVVILFIVVVIFLLLLSQEAERAKENLNGKKALGKKIIVDWAKQDQGALKNVSAGLLPPGVLLIMLCFVRMGVVVSEVK